MYNCSFSLSNYGPVTRIELLGIDSHTGYPTQVCAFRIGNTLIDTGSPRTLSAFLKSQEKEPPNRIILTHQHEDHMGGVAALCRVVGNIPVYCPEAHVGIVSSPYNVPPYRAAHWGNPEPYAKLIPYADGHVFEEKGIVIQSLLTPGHTPGHMSFHVTAQEEHFILSGDLYLGPMGIMAFGECSVPDFISSLERLATLPSQAIGLPSHGEVLTDPIKSFQVLERWYRHETDVSMKMAEEIGNEDYVKVFLARFERLKILEISSGGELGRLAHLRGIFEPVKSLPAEPIRMPE